MSLFQRFPYSEDASFTPLFRLLDDFDSYSREAGRVGSGRGGANARTPTFNPKFDVRETEQTYELHGELPGIDRKDVSIEFTEPQTIVVRGRVERNYTAGTPPAGLIEEPKASGAITDGGESNSHHASVSDEETEAAKEKGVVAAKKQESKAPAKPLERYWHQERSIGEFQRAFSFPTRVNESGVSATLNNGILHVSVPKATKHEKRSIAIN